MTVLLVHNRYQQPGGEDQAFDGEAALLREQGVRTVIHEVHNDRVAAMRRRSLLAATLWNHRTYRDIRGLIRTQRPDVVHCHNVFPLISPAVYWACRREGVPVVQTLHNFRLTCLNAYLFRDAAVCERCLGRFPWAGLRHRCYRDSRAASLVATLAWWLHMRLLRTYHRAVDRYIALTEFGRRKILEAGLPPDKVVVKPNLVAPPPPAADGAPGRDSDRPTALFVGRLSSEKGGRTLVAAWRQARSRLPPEARLEVLGDGPERAALEALAGPFETSGVRFLGRQSKARVFEAMRGAHLLVLPSLAYETFGMVLLEAAACGCPAIVTEHGAAASLVRNGATGFHVPPGDVRALADMLVRALSDLPGLAELGRRAEALYGSGDSVPARNVRRLLSIYAEVRAPG